MSLAHHESYFAPEPERAHYDLSEAQSQALTEELLFERPPMTDDRVVCYRLSADSKYANVGRTVERTVFERVFKKNDTEFMEREYGPYEEESIFFLSVDQVTKQAVGVLRVIQNGPNGFKTLNDLEELSQSGKIDEPQLNIEHITQEHTIDSLDDCWDVGTVAVRKELIPTKKEARHVAIQLYRALYSSAMTEDIQHFVSIIDTRPYKQMTDNLGIPFVPMAESKPFSYLGSGESQAVYGAVPEFYEKMTRGRLTSPKRLLARTAFNQLVKGSQDHTLYL